MDKFSKRRRPLRSFKLALAVINGVIRGGSTLLRIIKLGGKPGIGGESPIGRRSGSGRGEGSVRVVRAGTSGHVVRAFPGARELVVGFFPVSGVAAGFGHGAGVVDVTYVRVDDAGERKTRARARSRHASPSGSPA